MTLPILLSAQEKTLEFYYIAHSYDSRVEDICEMLEDRYEEAFEYDDCALIFYLPNGDNPLVFRMNLEQDDRNRFENFLGELRSRNYHDTYVYVDKERIVELFNQYDFLNDNGKKNFSEVRINWFVNDSFWSSGNNEYLIEPLFFILDINQCRDYVRYLIWNTGTDAIKFNPNKPFGNKNLMKGHPFHMLTL